MAGTTVRDNSEVETCFAQACAQTGLHISAERIKAVQGWSKRYVFQVLWSETLGENEAGLEKKIEHSYSTFKTILEKHYRENPIVPTEGFYRLVTDIILEKLGSYKMTIIDLPMNLVYGVVM
eukprot:gene41563-51483_t